jgi:hypothetical protein
MTTGLKRRWHRNLTFVAVGLFAADVLIAVCGGFHAL